MIETQLLSQLKLYPNPTCYRVAYSGGMDSHVLLYAMTQLKRQGQLTAPVHAIHINHQLQGDADAWALHCVNTAAALGIECQCITVNVVATQRESPEEAARRARYQAIAEHIPVNAMLLCAHHQRDQAETVLLQMLRGTGLKGLSAMPAYTRWQQGWLGRPLLGCRKDDLCDYALKHQLHWVEDVSNQEISADRNYLRHHVFPQLIQRWPQAYQKIARIAQFAASGDELISTWAQDNLPYFIGQAKHTLSVPKLISAKPAQCDALLRAWLQQRQFKLPSYQQLRHIVTNILKAKADANPCLAFAGVEIRRYQTSLYAIRAAQSFDSTMILKWDGQSELRLPGDLGKLITVHQLGQGISLRMLQEQPLTLRFRRGGERCQPHGRAHSHPLKKLLQAYGVPPWERQRLPLLYCGQELASVVGLWVCAGFAAKPDEWGVVCKIENNNSASG